MLPAAGGDVDSLTYASPLSERLDGAMRQFHAPGRVNLIGDHIDYMGGTVLPMSIDAGTDLWVQVRDDQSVVARSDNFPDAGEIVADVRATRAQPEWDWVNYLVAVAYALRKHGIEVPGVDVRVHGRIPNGAGLSSSASLESAMAVAFNELSQVGLSPTQLAEACQLAENEFIGVACGIMDQLSIARGVQGHALAIDCRTSQTRPIPFPGGSGGGGREHESAPGVVRQRVQLSPWRLRAGRAVARTPPRRDCA